MREMERMVAERAAQEAEQQREQAARQVQAILEALRTEYAASLHTEVEEGRLHLRQATENAQDLLSGVLQRHTDRLLSTQKQLSQLQAQLSAANERLERLGKVVQSHRANVQRYEHARRLAIACFALRDRVSASRPFTRELSVLRLAIDEELQQQQTQKQQQETTNSASSASVLAQGLQQLPAEVAATGVCSRAQLEARFAQLLAPCRRAALLPASASASETTVVEEDEKTAHSSSSTTSSSPSVAHQLMASVLSRVLLPMRGLVAGTHAEARLARIEYHLSRGDLHLALIEAEQITGPAAPLLSEWCRDATRLLLVEQILLLAESEARVALDLASPIH
mmetsp:Transcript_17731/g.53184  ORF Transcript_17731/g.53184 Transcript_17731/m.53184 type:complete len:339 (-) Transcript_17731:70-1086(-)